LLGRSRGGWFFLSSLFSSSSPAALGSTSVGLGGVRGGRRGGEGEASQSKNFVLRPGEGDFSLGGEKGGGFGRPTWPLSGMPFSQFRGRSKLNRGCAARLNREARSLYGFVWRAGLAQRRSRQLGWFGRVRNFLFRLEDVASLTAAALLDGTRKCEAFADRFRGRD
jgi:hypothetical protein